MLWVDCGNGSFANLQQHVHPEELTAVIITHSHPDHCVDLYGLHVLNKYGLERDVPSGVRTRRRREAARRSRRRLDRHVRLALVGDGDRLDLDGVALRFSRTDHPPPTVAVEIAHDGKRLVYTSDTGP